MKDGRRVAVFGRAVGKGTEIYVLACSKKDSFSHKFAKEVYANYLAFNLSFFRQFRRVKGKQVETYIVCKPLIQNEPFEPTNQNINQYLHLFLEPYIDFSYLKGFGGKRMLTDYI
jgi:hypothetical protein